MKILLYNIGYCSGLTGKKTQYVTEFNRYLHTPARIYQNIEQSIAQMVSREKPDLCCFLEVHKDFDLGEAAKAFHRRVIDNKYGLKSWLRKIPFFRYNCNAFFARKKLPYRKKFFGEGTKKLIYDIDLGHNLSLIVSHFSLSKRTRKKQFEELKQMVRNKMRVIVCGDFNIFDGEGELHDLVKSCNLRIVNARGRTFPTVKPQKHFDLFLCSKDVPVKGWKVLKDCKVSDHLPVMLEV
ncbi:MAG TPA: endonuclease/exonuclease/phosphatase family protein [Candidatus Peribacteraceae bacterium]|nr:endonuclease/exonuclease/phosphatase family protein [Candidatus Peribacteraceae bacterium]